MTKRKKPTNREITQVLNGLIMEIESIKIILNIIDDIIKSNSGDNNDKVKLPSDSKDN